MVSPDPDDAPEPGGCPEEDQAGQAPPSAGSFASAR